MEDIVLVLHLLEKSLTYFGIESVGSKGTSVGKLILAQVLTELNIRL